MAAINGLIMAGLLSDVSEECLRLDVSGKSDNIRYQEVDVMNALIIFMHVCNNVAIHNYNDKGMAIDKSLEIHKKHGLQLRRFVKRMTGIDPSKYYPVTPMKNDQ